MVEPLYIQALNLHILYISKFGFQRISFLVITKMFRYTFKDIYSGVSIIRGLDVSKCSVLLQLDAISEGKDCC